MEKETEVQISQKDFGQRRIILIGGAVFIILAGVVSGYFLARGKPEGGFLRPGGGESKVYKGMEVGSKDFGTFKDTAIGVLEKGGISGEGTHRLIREGGPSQTAYLTSSVINLDEFVGRKVKVWGETHKAQKAGWLMDVGRIQVLE